MNDTQLYVAYDLILGVLYGVVLKPDGEFWRRLGACCCDVMGDVVLDRLFCATGLSYGRKFCTSNALFGFLVNCVGLGKDNCDWIPCAAIWNCSGAKRLVLEKTGDLLL